jgi:hypothetical protein
LCGFRGLLKSEYYALDALAQQWGVKVHEQAQLASAEFEITE